MIKKFLLALLLLVVIIAAILVIKTFTFKSKQVAVETVDIPIPANPELHLSQAVQFQTVSYEDKSKSDSSAFAGLHNFFAEAYPLIDSMLELKPIGKSLLYKWEGKDQTLKPVILMSHQDVVPVDENTRDQWKAGPFSGEIKDGKIWGRGTLDDKVSLIAIMESVEYLLGQGFSPNRTIYLAFGHDEEVGGEEGAKEVAKYMESQNIKAEFVLDEGGYVAENMIPGLKAPVAIINVAEKGFVSFKITVTTNGGHSSAPPVDNTIGLLTRAINKLEANQFKYKLVEPMLSQLKYLGPELPFMQKVIFANPWLFGGMIAKEFNAHTTTAPTIINGGMKDNVIPTTAWAIVNFRILPGENVETVKKHIEDLISNEKITIEINGYSTNPSPISDIETASFNMIGKTIRQLIPGAVVTPSLVGGGTDATKFYGISNNVYRFFPLKVIGGKLEGFHGLNESISVENFHEITKFYLQLIKNTNEL